MHKYYLFLLIIVGSLYSCSDSELLTPGDEFQSSLPAGTYQVEFDGGLRDFSEITSALSNDALTNIDGENEDGQTIRLRFASKLEVGSYNQSQGGLVTIELGGLTGQFRNIDSLGQLLPLTIEVNEINMADKVVTGRFFGQVSNTSGEIIELTNGVFHEIPFEIEEGGDGILNAKFNGIFLDFSNNAMAAGEVTTAVISGENDEMQTIRISVPGGLEVGTLTEVDQLKFEVFISTTDSPNEMYTNYDQVNDVYLPVILNITEITEETGRVIGNFTGVIKKFNSNIDEEITITEGVIDVPISIGNP